MQWKVAITGLALAAWGQTAAVGTQDDAKVFLRLMPLGDSITDGYLSSDGNGYRKALFDLLTNDGHMVDMVGSRQAGNMADPDNEGWSGYLIDEVRAKAEQSVPTLRPNVIAVDIGANDAGRDVDVDGAGQRMDGTIESLWASAPETTIILATLTINLNDGAGARVDRINDMYRELVTRKQGEQKRIVLAEMHGDQGPQAGDLADGLHPNDVGYGKMANVWFHSIQDAEARGFLQNPV